MAEKKKTTAEQSAETDLQQIMDQADAQATQQMPPQNTNSQPPQKPAEKDSTLRLIAFIFALINTIGVGIPGLVFLVIAPLLAIAATSNLNALAGAVFAPFFLMPLAWMIPMTVRIYKIYKGRKPNTVAFGVCTLIFVNLVSGILLLCSEKDA